MSETQHTLKAIAAHIGASIDGHEQTLIRGIAPLSKAQPDQISFLNNPKYAKYLQDTQAAAVILAPEQVAQCPVPALVLNDPYLGYAKAAQLFIPPSTLHEGIHPKAVIGEQCVIDQTAAIGANAVIGNHVTIGANTIIHPGVVLGDHVTIGCDSVLYPNVTLYYGIKVGNNVIIQAGAVIGSDGFGMARDEKGAWLKIPQLGTVVIEDQVEIGANTTIDRGALDDTVISRGVKLDNQIQIGHNVVIGENTAMAACSGVSGSTSIGKNCMISGMVGFTGHFDVTDGVVITGATVVSKSITKPGIYSSGTAIEPHAKWRKNAVRFRQLDSMAQRIGQLEKTVNQINGESNNEHECS